MPSSYSYGGVLNECFMGEIERGGIGPGMGWNEKGWGGEN